MKTSPLFLLLLSTLPARLKGYVAAGRWHPAGACVDEGEVNISSFESMLRQVLYGNLFYQREFGRTAADYLLPDCFGFVVTVPSVLAHAGILGFSTQKLTWKAAVPIPFNIGLWEGPDGKNIIAALNATNYAGRVPPRLDTDSAWIARMNDNIRRHNLHFDYRYYGIGARSPWHAKCLNQPLLAFESPRHSGSRGRTLSIVALDSSAPSSSLSTSSSPSSSLTPSSNSLSTPTSPLSSSLNSSPSLSVPQVDVMALKKSEDPTSPYLILRLNELTGNPVDTLRIRLFSPITEAFEVDGQERRISPATLTDGFLITSMSPFAIRSFAISFLPSENAPHSP